MMRRFGKCRKKSSLTVGENTAAVEISLSTGTVRGSGHEPHTSLRFFHKLENGALTIHNFLADDEGAFEIAGIPAGQLTLQREGARGWVTLARPLLAAGETLTVE